MSPACLQYRTSTVSLLTKKSPKMSMTTHKKCGLSSTAKTLGDYHDLYLKTDVVLLTDVSETFRQTCMTTFKLDPLHYYTAPGLSWDALLKYTKSDLELLLDMDRKRHAWISMVKQTIHTPQITISKKKPNTTQTISMGGR